MTGRLLPTIVRGLIVVGFGLVPVSVGLPFRIPSITPARAEANVLLSTAAEREKLAFICTNMGRPLDESGLELTFEDEFDTPSVTGPQGAGPWYAPIHKGTFPTKYLWPRAGRGPFFYEDGTLIIRAEEEDGRWISGIIQSVNAAGRGFSQQYGYFEARMSFPRGTGSFPAFWLKTMTEYTDRRLPVAELDVVESYGDYASDFYLSSIHLWPAPDPVLGGIREHWKLNRKDYVLEDLFDGTLRRYGVEITPDWIVYYFDRKELCRVRTLPEFRHPMFLLVNLTLKDETKNQAKGPLDLVVDYVRVYQRSSS